MPPKIERLLSLLKAPLWELSEALDSQRMATAQIPYLDALLSGLAIFVLKIPSLLQYDIERKKGNLKKLFGIENPPSDTQMREMLDVMEPDSIRLGFTVLLNYLRRNH